MFQGQPIFARGGVSIWLISTPILEPPNFQHCAKAMHIQKTAATKQALFSIHKCDFTVILTVKVPTNDTRVSKAVWAVGRFLHISQWHFFAHATKGLNFTQSHVIRRRHISKCTVHCRGASIKFQTLWEWWCFYTASRILDTANCTCSHCMSSSFERRHSPDIWVGLKWRN